MTNNECDFEVVRALTAQEDIYWKLSFADQIHPVIAAHISGSREPEQWRAALDALQGRHPMLSVSIEPPNPNGSGPTQPYFRRRRGLPLPLRVVQGAPGDRWEAEIERELATPFQPEEAPLARAVLIQEPERSIFILSVSHSISDGVSLSFMVRDVLSTLAGCDPVPIAEPRPAEQLLGLHPVAPVAAPEDDLTHCNTSDELPRVQSLQLSQALTEDLIAKAGQEGTTVHGALAAAFVLAMRQQKPHFRHEPIGMISPVSIRSVLGVGQECGMYFTSPQAKFDPAQPTSFWDMARSTRQGVVEASTREALVAVTTAMQSMTAGGLTKAAAVETLSQAFKMDILLTNLGRTPYETTIGDLKLESLWLSVLGGPSVQTIGAASTDGSLCLLLTTRDPILRLIETAAEFLVENCK